MRWLRLYLTGLLFFYPFFWLALSLNDAIPKLFSLAFRGYRFARLDVSLWFLRLGVRPPDHGAAHPRNAWAHALRSEGLTLLVLLLVIVLLLRTKISRSLLAGFGVAIAAWTAFLLLTLPSVFGRRSSLPEAVIALLFFGAMCIGLRWIEEAAPQGGFLKRLLTPLTLAGLPVASFCLLLVFLSSDPPYKTLALALGSILCGALLANAFPLRKESRPVVPIGWKLAASGLGVTLVLGAGLYAGGKALDRAHAREAQAVLDALPPIPAGLPFEKIYFHRGVNYTAEFGAIYGGKESLEMLKRLPAYGVTSVALVPYAGASRGEPRIRRWENSWERDDGVRQLSRMAHSLGMQVLLKPQLWVEPGHPSDLEFIRPEDRARWFAAYQELLEHYARLATEVHADVFCIGVELERMSPYESDWRRLIARARELYPGALTYAANFGREFESVAFWDALDYIGLDEYYPLPDDLSTDDLLRRVESVHKKFSRPVLFTEAGFPSVEGANRQPWEDPRSKLDLDLQARAYDALFRAFYDKPWFKGMYWWKIGTNGYGGADDASHTPWRKPAMEVVRRWYAGQARQHTD